MDTNNDAKKWNLKSEILKGLNVRIKNHIKTVPKNIVFKISQNSKPERTLDTSRTNWSYDFKFEQYTLWKKDFYFGVKLRMYLKGGKGKRSSEIYVEETSMEALFRPIS